MRKFFVIIVLLGFAFFNLLTNIVFSIKVIDTDSELREIILADLEELGLKKYNFKISYKEKEKIVLYFAGEIESKELVAILKEKLPRYMIPNKVEKLDKMPLTANGKLDRVYLAKLYEEKKKEK